MQAYIHSLIERDISPGVVFGRTAETGLIQKTIKDTQDGAGHVRVMSGVPGVGKTALVRWGLEFALNEGLIIAGVRFFEHPPVGEPDPLTRLTAALVLAVEQSLGKPRLAMDPDPECLTTANVASPDDIAIIRCVLAGGAQGVIVPAAREMGVILGRILAELARRKPVLFVVEDEHWASLESCLTLQGIVDMAAGSPLTVVLTRRPGFGGTMIEGEHVQLCEVPPLDAASCGRLLQHVDPDIPPPIADAMIQKSRGNPLYLTNAALLRQTKRQHRISLAALPNLVHDVIRARIRGLGPDAKAILSAAAAYGTRFRPEEVLPLIPGLDSRTLFLELMDLKSKRLVGLNAQGAFNFAHQMIQRISYDETRRAHRFRLHRSIAERLSEAGRISGRLYADAARHAERAELWGRAAELRVRYIDFLEGRGLIDEIIESAESGLDDVERCQSPDHLIQFRLLMSLVKAKRARGLDYEYNVHSLTRLAEKIGPEDTAGWRESLL